LTYRFEIGNQPVTDDWVLDLTIWVSCANKNVDALEVMADGSWVKPETDGGDYGTGMLMH